MTRFLLPALLLLWAMTLQAAAPSSVPPRSTVAAAKVSDAEIDRTLRAKLAKSKLAVNKFQIQVQGGVVTIEGKTNVIQHKGIMTRMAKSAGARAVQNRIEISEAARAKAAARLEAGRRKAKVTRNAAVTR